MKRLAMILLICGFALVPGRADADGGGFWDWLWSWDPKFLGVSSEIHLLCLDANGNSIDGCRERFINVKNSFVGKEIQHCFRALKNAEAPEPELTADNRCPLGDRYTKATISDIKHEIQFRFGYHHNFGDRYHDPETTANQREAFSSHGSINVLRLMGMYYHPLDNHFSVGAGIGFLTIYGEGFDVFSRGIITPISFLIYPVPGWKALVLRPEINYIPRGFKAADFGDDPAKFSYSNTNEWNVSIAVGFDLRRVGTFLGR